MVADTQYYALLGVATDATPEEIKRAYRKLANQYHPDKTNGDKDKESLFIGIKQAYECLIDAHTRAKYDETGTGGQTRVQMEAKGILSTMFSQSIENKITGKAEYRTKYSIDSITITVADIIELTRENDVRIRADITSTKTEADASCDQLSSIINDILYDGNGQNLYRSVATDMFKGAKSLKKSTIIELEHQLDVNKEVLRMLDDYKDKLDEAAGVEFKPGLITDGIMPGRFF